MCIEVLKSKAEIGEARRQLHRRGLSFVSPKWKRLGSRIGIFKGINLGDEVKSWDVLKTIDFIEKNISKTAPVLDMGAFACEILCILHNLGYDNLTGIDLNPRIKEMPYADSVRYEVSDFMHTKFASESFQMISAISVIEHGFNSKLLLSEISRLLRPGGYFVASFDYCPDKVDTTGVDFFGMNWLIFSERETREFIEEAKSYNLTAPLKTDLTGSDKPIRCANKEYTFAWLVLQKALGSGGNV